MGLYTNGGKISTTTVNGSSYTGLHAANGTLNIVVDDADHTGQFHPCGAIRVNSSTGSTYLDGTGASYSNHLLGPGK